jgi:ABC-2 type transport system ATP-binding protein
MSVIVRNVTKIYGSQKALNNVSFELNPGEIVGFIGPNGAGKSTMMKIITGYIPQTEGFVSLNDIDITDDPIGAKRLIGYLPENNPLYLSMYVKEYLTFIAGLYNLGKSIKEKVNKMITLTGLSSEQKKRIGELSKGYRQRIGIAQSLIHDPQILILDEPTSGLDPNQIVEIRDLIKEVGRNKTIMLSTHIMQEVEAICSRIIIINNGEIVADGKTSEINTSFENKQTIVVEFNAEISSQLLQSIPGVSNTVKVEKNTWLVETGADTDIREKIFSMAVSNKLVVLSMQKKENKLEDVFRELTKKM